MRDQGGLPLIDANSDIDKRLFRQLRICQDVNGIRIALFQRIEESHAS